MGHRTLVAYRRDGGGDSGDRGDGVDGGGSDGDDGDDGGGAHPADDGDARTYDLHYAHWGIDPDDLTPMTPFGEPPDVEWARRRATELVEPEGGKVPDDPSTAVDPEPLAMGLSFGDVCHHVDPFVHEALHVVEPSFVARSYLVVSIGGGSGRPVRFEESSQGRSVCGRPSGVLIGYDDDERDVAYLRGWMAGARALQDVAGLDDGGLVRALRWLDPDLGTVIILDDGRSE